MDIKQIQELVKLINKTSIGEITIEEDGRKITIKQKKDPSQKIITSMPSAPVAAAMKLFNEIESEVKGTIVKVLVEDSSPVEYDQPLFLVEPA